MYCKKCGSEIPDGEHICRICNTNNLDNNGSVGSKDGFLPSFILGLIGAVFGICGGLCTTMCSSFYSSGVAPVVLIIGGSVIGLVGACRCLRNVKVGIVLEFIAAIMIIICAYGITGADLQTIFAMVMFLLAGAAGAVYEIFRYMNKK